jgi:hypothetical protein
MAIAMRVTTDSALVSTAESVVKNPEKPHIYAIKIEKMVKLFLAFIFFLIVDRNRYHQNYFDNLQPTCRTKLVE